MASTSRSWAPINRSRRATTSRSIWDGPPTGSTRALNRLTPWPASSSGQNGPRLLEGRGNAMQAFLEFVVGGLVQKPEELSITAVERNGMTIYELRMNPVDVGRIIGRDG